MDSYNPVYALESTVIAGFGPGPPVPGPCWVCWTLFTPLSQLSLLDWAPVLQFPSPGICWILFLPLGRLPLLVWGPVLLPMSFYHFLVQSILPSILVLLLLSLIETSSLLLCCKTFCVWYICHIIFVCCSTLSVWQSLCSLFNESYCCSQEFLFMNYVTST